METKTTPNFKTAKHTTIISDLHLCEAEPVHPKYPLWKKFKTKEFFFDHIFADFLIEIEKKAAGDSVELILNGDIFDFDSVTKQPEYPLFSSSWTEKRHGLLPRADKSAFKIKVILDDHEEFITALREFVIRGHRVVFITGNHDLELHFPEVQKTIRDRLQLSSEQQEHIRFVEWFYISNSDTLIEHGNQYDPYCVCEDPLTPFIRGYNFTSMKLPFGNQACRYITNAMGFFNPHVDTNYIMTLDQYVTVFLRYMVRAQPLIVFTWFFGALNTLWFTFKDRFAVTIKNPYRIEDKTEEVAKKSNSTPRMVRELKELFAEPASSRPFLVLQELWLDRAFLIMIGFF
ncbi:MAG: metallophosphoesterase, partial [Pseudobdellovibrionaceae bacterium]